MLADVLTGELDIADFCFLCAFVCYVVAALFVWIKTKAIATTTAYAGAALIAFGLMAL